MKFFRSESLAAGTHKIVEESHIDESDETTGMLRYSTNALLLTAISTWSKLAYPALPAKTSYGACLCTDASRKTSLSGFSHITNSYGYTYLAMYTIHYDTLSR